MKNTEKCLNPDCSKQPSVRGLCVSCYQTALKLVKKGRTSWEKLEKEGKVKRVGEGKTDIIKWILSK